MYHLRVSPFGRGMRRIRGNVPDPGRTPALRDRPVRSRVEPCRHRPRAPLLQKPRYPLRPRLKPPPSRPPPSYTSPAHPACRLRPASVMCGHVSFEVRVPQAQVRWWQVPGAGTSAPVPFATYPHRTTSSVGHQNGVLIWAAATSLAQRRLVVHFSGLCPAAAPQTDCAAGGHPRSIRRTQTAQRASD